MTAEVALTDPDLAVIVALPFSTDVTRPADDTVATVASDVDHVTEALDIVAHSGSLLSQLAKSFHPARLA